MPVYIFIFVLYLEMCAKLMRKQLARLGILCLTDASSCEHIIAVRSSASVWVLDETGDKDAKSPNGVGTPDATKVMFVWGTEGYV